MSQTNNASKQPKKKPQRARGLSLQVYLSQTELKTLKRIASRRELSNSELVRTWIVMHERRYQGQQRAANGNKRVRRSGSDSAQSAQPVREPPDPRQLSIVEAE